MTKDTGIYGAGAGMIQTGGFGARLFGYVMFYIAFTFVNLMLLMISKDYMAGYNFGFMLSFFLAFGWTAIPPFFIEKGIRKFRRKNGLSVYGNIREELEQMKFNKEYAKEAKAREAYEASKGK